MEMSCKEYIKICIVVGTKSGDAAMRALKQYSSLLDPRNVNELTTSWLAMSSPGINLF